MLTTKILGAAAALLALAATSVNAQAGEPLNRSQIAERTAGDQFEFRGRTQVWHFTPDGRVESNYTTTRLTLGGMGETFGLRMSGTWRRDGDRLCITWQDGKGSGCYTITAGRGSMVILNGPQSLEGSLETTSSAPSATAERPQPQPRPKPRGFGR